MAAGLGKRRPAREVALITGGSRGLGLAAARSLLEAGAQVAIVGRDAARLRRSRASLEREFERPVLAIRGDLGAPGTAGRVVARALRRFGRIDTVIAAAGDVAVGSLAALDHGAWQAAFAAKFFGHIALFRNVETHLRARGTGLLIALTGATGYEPSPDNLAAGAVNAALQNAMKALANDFGPAGIRVLTISPGPFLTDRLRTIARRQQRAAPDAALAKRFARDVPLGRIGDPTELGALVRFLHSPHSAFLHGTTIVMDGGKRRSA